MNITKWLFRLLLGRRLPTTEGTLEVTGIHQPVTIRRDRYGIATIEAQGDEDAWYGLGFCHGQDRAFQLEGFVRVVRGTLAEWVGPDGLVMDRLSRRIGFYRAAERQVQALDDETRLMLEAYARGAIDGARIGCRRPAHEFALLRSAPTPYTAADCLALFKLLSLNLAANWDSELARLKILREDGPEALAALDPTYPAGHPVTSPPGALAGPAVDRLSADLALLRGATGLGGGSNNWVLAGQRTAAGRPLLANDVHLGPDVPPYWYLAHVRTPEWAVAGASLVGAPAFGAGHNGTIAWGNTAGFVDNTDLFLEEIGPDGRSVRQGDAFVPCERRIEVIGVKGGDLVEEEVLITPRGPIVGPALEGEVGAISMRALWLDPLPVKGVFGLHRARSFAEFRRACAQWPFLSLNLVYADASGVVGWQLMGQAPQRRSGWGAIPLPGWDTEVGWEEVPLSFEQMPYRVDPEGGYLATANTLPVREGEGPFLSVDYVDGYRLARIVEALQARDDWDLPAMQALQLDLACMPWRELREVVLNVPAESPETRQALALLADWDGVLAADSPAAAVYEFFVNDMIRRIVEAKAPRSAEWAIGRRFAPVMAVSFYYLRRTSHMVRLLREQPEGWFGQPAGPPGAGGAEGPWLGQVADALATAVRTLRERCGDDPRRWAWGRIRTLTLRHSFGARAPLDRVFNLGPFPWGGDNNTVGQAGLDPLHLTGNPTAIDSMRVAIDVGNWDESRFVLPGGQSGNPLSPHYDDLLALWLRGEGVEIAWSGERVEEGTRSVLRLTAA